MSGAPWDNADSVLASVAQALLGHDSDESHQDYIKVGAQALRNAAEKLPDIR